MLSKSIDVQGGRQISFYYIMLKTRHIIFLLVPAILIVGAIFAVLVLRYEPLYPDTSKYQEVVDSFVIPLIPDDPILGDKRAPKTVIIFEDLACSACRTQSDLLHSLVEQYPKDVKVIWKMLSVTQFPYSTRAAHAYAYCANKQSAFDTFATLAFANSTNLSSATLQAIVDQMDINIPAFDACIASEDAALYLDTTENIARALNIQSVPAVFVNNEQVQTPRILDEWKTILQLP